jgi:hypothetical protein
MKNDKIYPLFVAYLEHRIKSTDFGDKLTESKVALLKISSSYFSHFKDKLEENELFQKRILEFWKTEIRDKKIEDIFDDTN